MVSIIAVSGDFDKIMRCASLQPHLGCRLRLAQDMPIPQAVQELTAWIGQKLPSGKHIHNNQKVSDAELVAIVSSEFYIKYLILVIGSL